MSKSSQILSALVSTIRGINGSPTYVNRLSNAVSPDGLIHQVESVDRSLEAIPQNQFPHFSVILQGEEREADPGFVNSLLRVEICCTFRKQTEVEVANWIADVEKVLAQDVRLGLSTFVHDTFVRSYSRDPGFIEPFRRVQMLVEVRYSYPFGNP